MRPKRGRQTALMVENAQVREDVDVPGLWFLGRLLGEPHSLAVSVVLR